MPNATLEDMRGGALHCVDCDSRCVEVEKAIRFLSHQMRFRNEARLAAMELASLRQSAVGDFFAEDDVLRYENLSQIRSSPHRQQQR